MLFRSRSGPLWRHGRAHARGRAPQRAGRPRALLAAASGGGSPPGGAPAGGPCDCATPDPSSGRHAAASARAAPRGLRAARCCAFPGPAGPCGFRSAGFCSTGPTSFCTATRGNLAACRRSLPGSAGAFLRGRSANPRRVAGRAAGGLRRRRDVRRSQGIAHIRAHARYNAMV